MPIELQALYPASMTLFPFSPCSLKVIAESRLFHGGERGHEMFRLDDYFDLIEHGSSLE